MGWQSPSADGHPSRTYFFFVSTESVRHGAHHHRRQCSCACHRYPRHIGRDGSAAIAVRADAVSRRCTWRTCGNWTKAGAVRRPMGESGCCGPARIVVDAANGRPNTGCASPSGGGYELVALGPKARCPHCSASPCGLRSVRAGTPPPELRDWRVRKATAGSRTRDGQEGGALQR
jgi:hypothetical protein